MKTRIGLRAIALGYLALILAVPVALVFGRTFQHGIGPVWDQITTPAAISALQLTLEVTGVVVVANTIFGVLAALAIVRGRFPGKALLEAVIDLPFAVSPVVVGLALVLVYGRHGFIHIGQVIFAFPGIAIATAFVTLPFVVREVVPVLREVGDEQEQAAATLGASGWQTFWRVTFPSLRWGLAYGVVLTVARAIGEYGAVSVVSGRIAGKTLTLTTLVQQRYDNLGISGAYSASALLAVIALVTLLILTTFNPRKEPART